MASLVGLVRDTSDNSERRLTQGGTSPGCQCGGSQSRRACAQTTGWPSRMVSLVSLDAGLRRLTKVSAKLVLMVPSLRPRLAMRSLLTTIKHASAALYDCQGNAVLTGVALESHGRRADLI